MCTDIDTYRETERERETGKRKETERDKEKKREKERDKERKRNPQKERGQAAWNKSINAETMTESLETGAMPNRHHLCRRRLIKPLWPGIFLGPYI